MVQEALAAVASGGPPSGWGGEDPTRECILLAACGANELLPQNPELPADVFTSCLTTPIKVCGHARPPHLARSRREGVRAGRPECPGPSPRASREDKRRPTQLVELSSAGDAREQKVSDATRPSMQLPCVTLDRH